MSKDNFNLLVPAQEERLFCLVEEIGEALQAIGKIGRHGYMSTHPAGGPTNRTRLENELGHVLYWIKAMAKKHDIEWEQVESHAAFKSESVRPYLHHQREGS